VDKFAKISNREIERELESVELSVGLFRNDGALRETRREWETQQYTVTSTSHPQQQ
jgi:hypothetical protein